MKKAKKFNSKSEKTLVEKQVKQEKDLSEFFNIKKHEDNSKRVCDIHHTPDSLIDNEHIVSGYRVNFNSFVCLLKSMFSWHNETINVWSHLLGTILIIMLVIYSSIQIQSHRQEILNNLSNFRSDTKDMLFNLASTFRDNSVNAFKQFEENLNYFKDKFQVVSCVECIQEMLEHLEDIKRFIVHEFEDNLESFQHGIENFNEKVAELRELVKAKLDSEYLSFVDLYHLQNSGVNLKIISRWPLFVFMFGAICCLLFSSIFHLFFVHSTSTWKFLAKLDYAGISILISTSCFPSYYYYFYCDSSKP